MTNKSVNKIVLTALFAAITFVATYIIKVPTLGTNGYVNIGDTMVLLSAWLIGGIYGGLAAGIGSAMSDLIAGYTTYVPGTLVIKLLMAIAAWLIFKAIKKANINKVVAYIVSSVVAELIMVFGYFLYESTLLGYGMTAAASIPSNGVQGITCLVLGLVLVEVLNASNAFKSVLKVN